MDFSQKADSLAAKMNKITEQLDLSEELLVEGSDIVEYVEDKTQDITLYEEKSYADIMNLQIMTDDFKYVRETLREVTDNARRVQNAITLDLLDTDDDKRAALVVSFAELSKAITDAQKLYVSSYKEMSTTLLNLDKIKKAEKAEGPKTINNTLNVTTAEPISTTDLIQQLRGNK